MNEEEIRALIKAEVAEAVNAIKEDFETQLSDLRDELKESGVWDPNW